jgi:hypothetical protein
VPVAKDFSIKLDETFAVSKNDTFENHSSGQFAVAFKISLAPLAAGIFHIPGRQYSTNQKWLKLLL